MTPTLSSLPQRLARLEPYAIEVVLSLSSLWAAWVLTTGPGNFLVYPHAFELASRLGNEHEWACAGIIAATLKISGLLLCRTAWVCTALVLRLSGIAMSGSFWFLLGLSAVEGNPDTLFGFPVLLLGISAWWLLIRFPTLPNSSKGSI
jgi:hypothetical protein